MIFLNQSLKLKVTLRKIGNQCVSSVEEDECFYDVDSLVNSQDVSYYSFPTRSLISNFDIETHLSGLAMGCEHPSKADQVPNLNEKAYLTQKSQVPELNETHLVEGRKLSSMMEKGDTC